jgi:hypothetical protein
MFSQSDRHLSPGAGSAGSAIARAVVDDHDFEGELRRCRRGLFDALQERRNVRGLVVGGQHNENVARGFVRHRDPREEVHLARAAGEISRRQTLRCFGNRSMRNLPSEPSPSVPGELE